jgi:hypothetical protein
VKLFQIEEPEGGPTDPSEPGAAIGIDASGAQIEVAFSVGGNALVLADREGFERLVPAPSMTSGAAAWGEAFEAARIRAERALARPVTHAVVVLPRPLDGYVAGALEEGAERAGLTVLRVAIAAELPSGAGPALAAAGLAEDLVPRPE